MVPSYVPLETIQLLSETFFFAGLSFWDISMSSDKSATLYIYSSSYNFSHSSFIETLHTSATIRPFSYLTRIATIPRIAFHTSSRASSPRLINERRWMAMNVTTNASAAPRLPFSSREIHILFFSLLLFLRPIYMKVPSGAVWCSAIFRRPQDVDDRDCDVVSATEREYISKTRHTTHLRF